MNLNNEEEVLGLLTRLLDQLHQADLKNFGSKIEIVYVASGGQHVENQYNIQPLPSPFPSEARLPVAFPRRRGDSHADEGVLLPEWRGESHAEEPQKNHGNQITTLYFGDYEERTDSTGTESICYLDGGVMIIHHTDGTERLYVPFTDHLGSYLDIYNENAQSKFRATYDAWGRQTLHRNDIGFHRGYTGHEMLPEFGLINMNGRLYDPLLGRFLSTDDYVQAPFDSQSFNRYSYCLNNPLKYTDPDGERLGLSLISGFIRGVVEMFESGDITAPITYSYKNVLNDLKIQWGLFQGSPKQIISRFTWELPQTYLGYEYSQFRLVSEKIDHVEYFDGATYVINDNSHSQKGITLGSYININDWESMPVDEDGDFAPQQNPLYMHEYGHYLQSQDYGWSYLFDVGIPSLLSADHAQYYNVYKNGRYVGEVSTHELTSYEIDANKRAHNYFFGKTGFHWDYYSYPLYNYTQYNPDNLVLKLKRY